MSAYEPAFVTADTTHLSALDESTLWPAQQTALLAAVFSTDVSADNSVQPDVVYVWLPRVQYFHSQRHVFGLSA